MTETQQIRQDSEEIARSIFTYESEMVGDAKLYREDNTGTMDQIMGGSNYDISGAAEILSYSLSIIASCIIIFEKLSNHDIRKKRRNHN